MKRTYAGSHRVWRVVSGLGLLHDPQPKLAQRVRGAPQALGARFALEAVGLAPVSRPARQRSLFGVVVLEGADDTLVGFGVVAE